MKALLDAGLLFGGLLRIDEPHLVARYNAALEGLHLAPTALTDFHVDAAGYSPEVAAERGDESYLDPQGVNRLFVVLSPRQRNLPIIRTHFSADLTVFRRWFDANMRSIETLTLHDAVYGEMENLVLKVETPADVVGFTKIEFLVHTPSGILEKAQDTFALAERFGRERDSWRDQSLMERIVAGAKACGDVRRNGISPNRLTFDWPDIYHTTHFGGAYVVRHRDGVLLFGDPGRLSPLPDGAAVFPLLEAEAVLRTLSSLRVLEDVSTTWMARSEILDHRIAMVAAEILLGRGVAFDHAIVTDDRICTRVLQANHDTLLADPRFRALYQLRSLVVNGGDAKGFVKGLGPDLNAMVRRALPDVPDVWEVNRLLSEFASFDLVTLFMLNKPRFYEAYEGMTDAAKAFAVHAIKAIYQPDGVDLLRHKHSVRERFFGTH